MRQTLALLKGAVLPALCILIFAVDMSAQCVVNPRIRKIDALVTDSIHTFMEYLPVGYDTHPNEYYPLLIYWAGSGEIEGYAGGDVNDFCDNLLSTPSLPTYINEGRFPDTVRDQSNQPFSYIVIAPLVAGFDSFNPFIDNVGNQDSLINFLIENYRVDTRRIYITGMSWGSYLVMDYATSSLANAQKVAAVSPQSNCFPDTMSAYSARLANIVGAGVNLWGTSCVNDDMSGSGCWEAWIEGWAEDMNSLQPGSAVGSILSECTGGHHAWQFGYDTAFRPNGVNLYEYFIQYTSNFVLPALLKNYSVRLHQGKVIVEWITTAEQNTDHFLIQRADERGIFRNIGSISAAGFSSVERKYSFTDAAPLKGHNQYRLTLVDRDTRKETFAIKKIFIPTSWKGFVSIPNPVSGVLPVYIDAADRAVIQISIFDLTGKVMHRQQRVFSNGISVENIDVSKFSKGTYVVQVRHEKGVVSQKVVIR